MSIIFSKISENVKIDNAISILNFLKEKLNVEDLRLNEEDCNWFGPALTLEFNAEIYVWSFQSEDTLYTVRMTVLYHDSQVIEMQIIPSKI